MGRKPFGRTIKETLKPEYLLIGGKSLKIRGDFKWENG